MKKLIEQAILLGFEEDSIVRVFGITHLEYRKFVKVGHLTRGAVGEIKHYHAESTLAKIVSLYGCTGQMVNSVRYRGYPYTGGIVNDYEFILAHLTGDKLYMHPTKVKQRLKKLGLEQKELTKKEN